MTHRPAIRILLFGVSLAVVTGASTFSQGPKLAYRLVLNPVELPKNVVLGEITGLDVDSKDNLLILRQDKPYVLMFDQAGKHLRSWNGEFDSPHGLRIDRNDHVWIADRGNHLVQKFTREGKLLLRLGTKDEAGADERRFDEPADAIEGPEGAIYVADGYGNSRIVKFSRDGKFLKEWGKNGAADGEFDIPHAIAWDPAGKLFVSDRENARVQIFDGDGKHEATWKNTGYPYGLYRRDGKTYLADGESGDIRILGTDGTLLSRWSASEGSMDFPHWLCVDSKSAIYVGYVTGKKIQKWTKDARPAGS
jgi:sugar lactone lactonase YvrE